MNLRTRLLFAGAGLTALLLTAALAFYLLRRPAPPPGRLVVRTVPNGVRVTVNDTFRGVTVDTGLVLTLPVSGHYHMALSRVGFATDTSTIYMGLDEVLEVDVVMKIPGMAYVRGGTFAMGDEAGDYNEKPVHRVSVQAFYIDRTEVTAADFRKFRPNHVPPFAGGKMPAGGISWEEARDYCRSEGKRLPTEAEWERACRGAGDTRYSYGDTYRTDLAQTGRPLDKGPAPAGSFSAGNGGLHDVTGNLWEWCADWYGRDYYQSSPERNPTGPAGGHQHVLRGGAWYSNARYARCAHRPGNIRKDRDPSFGFRCVKDVE